jgi:DNA-binding response OmpR family regulator
MALRLGATRCLRKPFRPATLLSVIDECLSDAEPHRKYVATLAAVANAVSEPKDGTGTSSHSREGAFIR